MLGMVITIQTTTKLAFSYDNGTAKMFQSSYWGQTKQKQKLLTRFINPLLEKIHTMKTALIRVFLSFLSDYKNDIAGFW